MKTIIHLVCDTFTESYFIVKDRGGMENLLKIHQVKVTCNNMKTQHRFRTNFNKNVLPLQ